MKKIVIMGASSGIGYHMAELLASRGMKVGLAARHTSTLQQHKDRYPDCVEYMSIDVTKPEAVDRLTELAEKIGGMDIYFHVAGIGFENLGLLPEREVEIVNTNAAGFARMVCAAYRYFRDKGVRGQIAAVTSVAGTNGIGRLSAYCGAVSAGCGAAAGVCKLRGGSANQISHAITNAIAIDSGMICDGAKSSCAAKIASSVEAGLVGMEMALNGVNFSGGDGILVDSVEDTIDNVGDLARDSMRETDETIIKLMINN